MRLLSIGILLLVLATPVLAEYYELRVYHLADAADEARVDAYLKDALLPALHRQGIAAVGVFKPVDSDTVNDNRIYVLIPHATLEAFELSKTKLFNDQQYRNAAKDFIDAPHTDPPYRRMEVTLMKAFYRMPALAVPKLDAPKSQRIYELRSYEGATEAKFLNKVEMFNEGSELVIFDKLQFNAVFYAHVLSGAQMPNLLYMTSFENMQERDKHWQAFNADPDWRTLRAKPEYQNNVSKANIYLLKGVDYSDI